METQSIIPPEITLIFGFIGVIGAIITPIAVALITRGTKSFGSPAPSVDITADLDDLNDRLVKENERLTRENDRLRQQLTAERMQRTQPRRKP